MSISSCVSKLLFVACSPSTHQHKYCCESRLFSGVAPKAQLAHGYDIHGARCSCRPRATHGSGAPTQTHNVVIRLLSRCWGCQQKNQSNRGRRSTQRALGCCCWSCCCCCCLYAALIREYLYLTSNNATKDISR